MEQSVIDRIRPYIEIETDNCVEYPVVDHDGYGSIQTISKGIKKHYKAHRLVYSIVHNIQLSPENVIMHSCDNPSCVNIRHLSVGTHKDNSDDKVRKNRQAKGNKNGRYKHGVYTKEAILERIERRKLNGTTNVLFPKGHKPSSRTLSENDVAIIKSKIQCETVSNLAKMFGVKRTVISDIKRGRAYKNILALN